MFLKSYTFNDSYKFNEKIHDDNFICNIEENSIHSVKIGFLGIFWYHYSESYVFFFVKFQDQL